jgi:hypothetical protein
VTSLFTFFLTSVSFSFCFPPDETKLFEGGRDMTGEGTGGRSSVCENFRHFRCQYGIV